MSGACVNDTPGIELLLVGSPESLEANIRNPSASGSGTLGDDTTHNVTDTGVVHTLSTPPFTVDNSAGTLALRGIVVVAINPIFVHATGGPISAVPFARLTIDSVIVDERDVPAAGIDVLDDASMLLSLGSLTGELAVPPGTSIDIDVLITIEQIAASTGWSFRFGGSKLVWSESF